MKRFFLIFMVSSIIAFFFLGFWQLKRLAWKSDLIQQAQLNSLAEPIHGLSGQVNDKMFFTKVQFDGKMLDSKKILLVESCNKQYFYRIFAPVLIDKKIVVVDFGLTKDKNIVLPEIFSTEGIIFNFDRKNFFYPSNDPAKNLWYNLDYHTMKSYFVKNIENYYLKITPGHALDEQMIIKPFATSYRNDHLMYALTWLSLGIACSIILYYRVKN